MHDANFSAAQIMVSNVIIVTDFVLNKKNIGDS
jgi:hypothetical protein